MFLCTNMKHNTIQLASLSHTLTTHTKDAQRRTLNAHHKGDPSHVYTTFFY